MISISFFATVMHIAMGYTSSTKNVLVFSCVYLPELFVDMENVCPAEYDCWNSQLRDYSRYFLFKQFAVHRSNVATATCNDCGDAHYSNMFLMYYHWYLEHMAIHLSKKFKCPFLNKSKKEKDYPRPFVFNDSPHDLPKVEWPPLEPKFLGYQYHFAGFTFKLNKRNNTHDTMLQKVLNCILNDNMRLDLFDSWNSTGHYMLASATLFGCTLIHFTHVTGKTALNEDVFNGSVGYFACVFAAKGQLTSQYGDLNAKTCLENNGVLQNWDDVSLCTQRRSSEEEMRQTPCQVYYNTDAMRNKVKRYKLCPRTSSNFWLKVEAPHEHEQTIEVYFSDNDVISVSITPIRDVHANWTLKATPLIYFPTSSSSISPSTYGSGQLTPRTQKFETTSTNIGVYFGTVDADVKPSLETNLSKLDRGPEGTDPISQIAMTLEQKSREATSVYENSTIVKSTGVITPSDFPPLKNEYNGRNLFTSEQRSATTTSRYPDLVWDINNTATLARFTSFKYDENWLSNSSDAMMEELENFFETTYSPPKGNNSVSKFNGKISMPLYPEDNSSTERNGDEESKGVSSTAIRGKLSHSTVRFRFPKARVISPLFDHEIASNQHEHEDSVSHIDEDAEIDCTEPENVLQWLSCQSNMGYFLIACPIFLILLVILVRTHD